MNQATEPVLTDRADSGVLFGFGACKRIESPTVIVTRCDDLDHPPMPLDYFLNGYQRHHEKLSGMAGDWIDNRLHACEPNTKLADP